jgi:hypothetical protein
MTKYFVHVVLNDCSYHLYSNTTIARYSSTSWCLALDLSYFDVNFPKTVLIRHCWRMFSDVYLYWTHAYWIPYIVIYRYRIFIYLFTYADWDFYSMRKCMIFALDYTSLCCRLMMWTINTNNSFSICIECNYTCIRCRYVFRGTAIFSRQSYRLFMQETKKIACWFLFVRCSLVFVDINI